MDQQSKQASLNNECKSIFLTEKLSFYSKMLDPDLLKINANMQGELNGFFKQVSTVFFCYNEEL